MFKDKNGVELEVGDYIIPDEGMELLLVSIAYVPSYKEECLFGQQILDPLAFSLLTQEDLSAQWTKTDPPTTTYVTQNLRSGTLVEIEKEKPVDDEAKATKINNEEDFSDVRKVKIYE